MSHKMILVMADVDGDEIRCQRAERDDGLDCIELLIGDEYVHLERHDSQVLVTFIQEWQDS